MRRAGLSPFLLAALIAGSACNNPNGPGGGNGGGGGGGNDPPTITCPAAPPTITSPTGGPTAVAYGTAIATGTGVTVGCAPASGSNFPVGSTTVVCTATDSAGRTAACSFNVTVQTAVRISLTRFMAFGDSITWGEDGRFACGTTVMPNGAIRVLGWQVRPECQLPFGQRYPDVLTQDLRARYVFQTPNVANQGCPGEMASGNCTYPSTAPPIAAVTRFQSLIATRAYDSALVMEGANDLGGGTQAQSVAIENLRTMLRSAKSAGVRPFLATITPMVVGACDPQCGGANAALVPGFNNLVRSLAFSEGVTLVDVNAGMGGSFAQYIGPDGLHPNPAGYQKIADIFFGVLQQTLEVTPTTTTTPTNAAGPTSALPRSPARRRP
jgi:lysophospholipase L1-like esterase